MGGENFSLTPGKTSLDRRYAMVGLCIAILFSLVLFSQKDWMVLSPVPLLLFIIGIILPKIGKKFDQALLLCFMSLAFIIDDIAQAPWNDLQPMTESLGDILFRSFGLTGFELFTILFSLMCLTLHPRDERKKWLPLGVVGLLAIASSFFFATIPGIFWGIATGGTLEVALIQIRFLYLLPLWAWIGFVVIRDRDFMLTLLNWVLLLTFLKSCQALLIYLLNRGQFAEAEYLYDHHFSAFAALALLHCLYHLSKSRSWANRLLILGASAIISTVYILNDRRTSYVGVALAILALLALLPGNITRRYGRKIATALVLGLGITGITWNLPAPFGLIGSLYRSFGQEAGEGGPSYRDLENANMLREVAAQPLLGLGFGKEFEEKYPMPSVASVYPRYKMIPHNNLLFAWCYGGPIGIAGLSLLLFFLIALAGGFIFEAQMSGYRYLGIAALVFFMQFFSYVFGDLGLQVNRLQLMTGLFLGGCFRIYRQRKGEFL